jgi:hypothetical protein
LDTCDKHELSLSLHALEKTTLTTEATANSVMDVDEKEAADRQQLQELIRKQTTEHNKLLKLQLSKLEKEMKQLKVKKHFEGP